MRREVESLLAQDAESLLQSTVTLVEAGAQFGPYKIEAPIGAGGMGQVFRAKDTRLHRTVAVKILCPATRSPIPSASAGSCRRLAQLRR